MSPWLAGLPAGSDLALLVVFAAVAGVINAMAGGGSLLLIPLLIAIGLPPTVANGTLRVAVVAQTLLTSITFHRRGVREHRAALALLAPMLVGAAAGTWLATRMPDTSMRAVFGVLLAAWALLLLLRPDRFIAGKGTPRSPAAWVLGLAVIVGSYGGLLQAGVGFPLLALIVVGMGRTIVAANAIKSLLVLAYSAVSLSLFASTDLVAWREGLALAGGAALGGWLGARWQLQAGVSLVRWVLIVTVAVSAVAMLVPA